MNNIQKRVLNILGGAALALSITGCLSELDITPPDQVGIDRVLNKVTVENLRARVYDQMNSSFINLYSGQVLEAYTDDAFRGGSTVAFDWHNGILSPEIPLFGNSIWNNYWQGIRKCNIAIEYLPQATVSDILVSEDQLNQWVDEALLMRAWYHFELLRFFGPVPFVEEALSADFSDWGTVTRPTADDLFSKIIADIDQVIANDNLPLRHQLATDYDRLNMGVAHALKSRVLLYAASPLFNSGNDAAKWTAAATASQDAISAMGGEYSLVGIANYGDMFLEDQTVLNQEVILRGNANNAGVLNTSNGVDLSVYGSNIQSNNAGAVPTQELVDCFELTDGTLPVSAYNANHTSATFNAGYSEGTGDDPYANRDARFYASIVFNGADYGRYKGMPGGDPNVVVYTFVGQPGSGFNGNPLSEIESEVRRSSTGYYTSKFRTAGYWGSTAGGTNSFKIHFRFAELYLNLAEASCEANDLAGALSALNMVRNRAGQPNLENVPDFANTQEFIRERIRNEKRVEFCFENHRFFDQRRWDVLSTNDVISGMRITSSDGTSSGDFSYQRVNLSVPREATSDKYLQLPVPIEEARRLPGLGQPEAWN
ncbi:RagB/SusD family nutrient uptake outer membrane protein [Marinoscillum furvescens]|nr:RagB/SusD family nutrient uptake outer membrane protein [Marinoscillum furvescens]